MIGEIASRISDETREALPHLPWHEIRGMRNRLAHDYLGVDVDEVWRTATVDLSELEQRLLIALGRG